MQTREKCELIFIVFLPFVFYRRFSTLKDEFAEGLLYKLIVLKEDILKRLVVVVFAVVFTWTTLFAQTNGKRPMTVDERLEFVEIGNVILSPDRDWVFYSKTELDWDRNGKKMSYYMIPANGGEAIQYIGEAGGESFQFSNVLIIRKGIL